MPISVTWFDDDRTTLHYTFDGDWTWEEFYEADKTAYTMLKTIASRNGDLIVDLTHSTGIPSGMLSHVRSLFGRERDGWGNTAVIGPSRFYMSMFDMLRRLSPHLMHSFFIAESIEDATAKLYAMRETPTP